MLYTMDKPPSKHFLFSKTSSRRLEDVFSVTLFVFQDIFKTYLRYVFQKRLQDAFKTSSRCVCKTSCNYVFKTSLRRLGRQKNVTLKMSSPRRIFAGKDVQCRFLLAFPLFRDVTYILDFPIHTKNYHNILTKPTVKSWCRFFEILSC